MNIKPISIKGNLCREFRSKSIEEISVIEGGYIFTPRGEIILVGEDEEHCNVFSDYINSHLENASPKIYDTLVATKILCELGCCVYAGVRYKEYIGSALGDSKLDLCSLTFPDELSNITEMQKNICLKLISTNKSVLGDREKVYIQYGSFPDIVYDKDEVIKILESKQKQKD